MTNIDPKHILSKYWGYDSFRSQQEEIIKSVITGNDTLVLMPTGGGKSLCYQVPALVREGLCIVISPLVALIQDQVEALQNKDIKAKGLTGHIPYFELIDILDACEYGKYKFLYLSPERFLQDIVLERLQKMNISLVAIDEAHCISEWGHDFRPKYLDLKILKEYFPNTPLIALTATAPKKVKKDIQEILNLDKPTVFQSSYLRKNLSYGIYQAQDIHYLVKKILKKQKGSSIVYVPTRSQTQLWSKYLVSENFTALPYHGGMDSNTKKKNFESWKSNKVQVIVATNAFGMGIDKPDVRTVIHTFIPNSIENYFQEAGRAGRDGKQAYALLIQTPNAINNTKEKHIASAPDIKFIKELYRRLSNYLQIAYGEGQEKPYPIDFIKFCDRYKFNKPKTYNALRLLNNQGVLSLLEKYYTQWIVKIEVSAAQFIRQTQHNQTSQKIAEQLQRKYEGIFITKTYIDLSKIASLTAISQNTVKEHFDQWHKIGLLTFEEQQCDLEITFLTPREDDITINRISKYLKSTLNHQKKRLDDVLKYVTNNQTCRQRQLLQYFGESLKEDCNNCSNCIKKKNQSIVINKNISEKIHALLAQGPLTSRILFEHFSESEEQLILILQYLLAKNKITILPNNTYSIVKE